MVSVIFACAIIPMFLLLAVLNSQAPEKSGCLAANALAADRQRKASNARLIQSSMQKCREVAFPHQLPPSLNPILGYRVKRIFVNCWSRFCGRPRGRLPLWALPDGAGASSVAVAWFVESGLSG